MPTKKGLRISKMAKPKALVFSGYGLNCEEETKHAFDISGAEAQIIHINDLIANPKLLKDFQILSFPGGFSYGDDTGSGNAYANKIKNNMWEDLATAISKDVLAIGICNGFQIIVNLGLLPAIDKKYGDRQVALLHNDNARYTTRWVDLKVESNSPWLKDISDLSLPIAHGEGKFFADPKTLSELNSKGMIALRYTHGKICQYQDLSANPNGSIEDIAGITDETGKILGLMPHPERAMFFTQLPHWTFLKEGLKRKGEVVPESGPGIQIFENAVNYFK